jgi:hypothetical protein
MMLDLIEVHETLQLEEQISRNGCPPVATSELGITDPDRIAAVNRRLQVFWAEEEKLGVKISPEEKARQRELMNLQGCLATVRHIVPLRRRKPPVVSHAVTEVPER